MVRIPQKNLGFVLLAMGCVVIWNSWASAFEEQGLDIKAKKVKRLVLEEKGFSIVPPPNWEILDNQSGLTLFMQMPKKDVKKYRRSIQVRFGREVLNIDRHTARRFTEVIARDRSKAFSVAENNYKVREPVTIHMSDGSPGLLYYGEVKFEGEDMMEMHVLISSEKGHFIMTYTDLAQQFGDNGPGTSLDVAYRSLISAHVDSHPGGRFDFVIRGGIVVVGFLLCWFVLRYYQGRKHLTLAPEEEEQDYGDVDQVHSDLAIIRDQTSIESHELHTIQDQQDLASDDPKTWVDTADDDFDDIDFDRAG